MIGAAAVVCTVEAATEALHTGADSDDTPVTFVHARIAVDATSGDPHPVGLADFQYSTATVGELAAAVDQAGEGNVFWSSPNPEWHGDRCLMWRIGSPHDRHVFGCPKVRHRNQPHPD